LLSSVIWIIAVVGAERTSVDRVLAEAGEAGIKVGLPRAGVDPEAAATRILSSVDGLAWVGVRSRGGMVIIEIVEKKTRIPDFLTDVPCDIIAGCNGVIVKLVPLQGNAVAAQGATVRAGQVLISGAVPELAQAPDKDQGNNHDTPEPDKVSYPGFVRAQGIALATVWYEAYAEVPLRSIVKVNTGKTEKSLVLGYNGRYVVIYGKRQPSFSDYGEDERVLWRFSWRNRTGTVELKTITFNEVLSRPTTLSLEQATLQAKEEALKKVFERIPPGAEQVRTWASVVQEGPDAAGIKVTVETVEDIGVPKPLFQEPTVRAN
jgi:similar to stage IV sporulation protein